MDSVKREIFKSFRGKVDVVEIGEMSYKLFDFIKPYFNINGFRRLMFFNRNIFYIIQPSIAEPSGIDYQIERSIHREL